MELMTPLSNQPKRPVTHERLHMDRRVKQRIQIVAMPTRGIHRRNLGEHGERRADLLLGCIECRLYLCCFAHDDAGDSEGNGAGVDRAFGGNGMTRAEAIEAFHRASMAFSAMSIEVQGELHTISRPSARVQLLEAMARAEHALIAAHDAISKLYFPKEERQ